MGGKGRREDLQGLLDLDGRLAVVLGSAQQGGKNIDVVGSEHGVHPGRLLHDAVSHLLSEAPADRDLHAGTLALDGSQLAKIPKEAGRSVFPDRTSVDDDNVRAHVPRVGGARGGLGDLLHGNQARLLKQARHSLRVVFVHLAAERAHRVGARQRSVLGCHRIHRPKV